MIKDELSKAIDSWLSERPRIRNLSVLARLSNVSYATVRRLSQQEAEPSFDVFLRIGAIVLSKEQLLEYCRKYFPDTAKALEGMTYDTSMSDQTRAYYQSETHYPIIVLAAKDCGTTVTEVRNLLGKRGVEAIDDLLTTGVIESRDEKLFFSEQNIYLPDNALARNQMKILLSLVNSKHDSIPRASGANLLTEGLSPEAVRRANDIMREANRDLFQVVTDPGNHGNITWVSGYFHICLSGEEGLR